jgi:hypothetical protein
LILIYLHYRNTGANWGRAGGFVGAFIGVSASIKNCAALGGSVSAVNVSPGTATVTAGRIIANTDSGLTLEGNVANAAMKVNGVEVSSNDAAGIDGKDIALANHDGILAVLNAGQGTVWEWKDGAGGPSLK